MAYLLSDNARTLITYLRNTQGANEDAHQIADGVDLPVKTVNGVATALVRRGLVERVEVEGRERKIIQITPEGLTFDIDTPKPEK